MSEEKTFLSADELDAIGEVMNMSMGSAATAVSTMLEKQVIITTPGISQEQFQNIDYSNLDPAVVVRIKYVEGIDGENAIVFRKRDMQIILNLLMGNDGPVDDENFEFDDLSMSAACEVMNQMMGSSATALSKILDMPVNISTPTAYLANGDDIKQSAFSEIDPESQVVSISFKMMIKDLLDTTFCSIMTTQLAKRIVERVVPEAPPAPTPQPERAPSPTPPQTIAPEPQPAAAPVSPAPQPDAAPVSPAPAPTAAVEQPPMAAAQPQPVVPAQPTGAPTQPAMAATPQAPQAPAYTAPPEAPAQPPAYAPAYGAQGAGYPGYPQTPPGYTMPPMGYGAQSMPMAYPQPAPMQGYTQPMMNLQNAEFPEFSKAKSAQPMNDTNMGLLMNVKLEVSVVIGTVKKSIRDIIDFGQGTVVELDKQTGAPADIIVNGQMIARGDVMVVGDNFGVRITELTGTKELMDSLESSI